MELVEPSTLVLRNIAVATLVLLALTEQYAAMLAAAAAYPVARLLVRTPARPRSTERSQPL